MSNLNNNLLIKEAIDFFRSQNLDTEEGRKTYMNGELLIGMLNNRDPYQIQSKICMELALRDNCKVK